MATGATGPRSCRALRQSVKNVHAEVVFLRVPASKRNAVLVNWSVQPLGSGTKDVVHIIPSEPFTWHSNACAVPPPNLNLTQGAILKPALIYGSRDVKLTGPKGEERTINLPLQRVGGPLAKLTSTGIGKKIAGVWGVGGGGLSAVICCACTRLIDE